ncbi:2-oxoacid:acceptor oxidoreductase subunit alpha [Patescibacteria group bacterium]
MPKLDYFTFKIGGPAGFGIKSMGLNFAKVATRSGYHIYDYSEYPSLIRGGHNAMQVTVSEEPVYFTTQHTNFLVALNQETIDLHCDELVDGAIVLFDSDLKFKTDCIKAKVENCSLPLAKIVSEAGGIPIMRNTAALGAALAMLDGSMDHFNNLISAEFKNKKPEVTELNQKVAKAGYDYAKTNFKEKIKNILTKKDSVEEKIVINANEAAALGAISAGLGFAAIYPMTPTSNILHNLAPHQEEYGFVYKQPEDEIAALTMALGASNAGLRSMVATSGGGFALMSEGYGLAGLTETPVVIIEGMRGAPATGIPTWNEQGDLRFILHAHQGDFPRIVLAAGDAKEAFYLTQKAFDLADKYQTPVVLIVDKIICEDDQSYSPFKYDDYQIDRGKLVDQTQKDYKRYALSKDGISPRSPFGLGNHFLANADEHDEQGYSNEEIKNRNDQMHKRMQKLITCEKEDMQDPVLFGPGEADITLVSWGSNKGAIREAIKHFDNVNFLHITWMNPFPSQLVKDYLENAKYIINIEQNYSAQLRGLIMEKTGINIQDTMLRYDGRPIYSEQIIEKINQVLGDK